MPSPRRASALTVLVATLQGLKMHGGVAESEIREPNAEGVVQGFANLDRHIANLQAFGQSVVVCFNRYAQDTEEEIELVRRHCAQMGVPFALNEAFLKGGEGAEELARLVVETIENEPSGELRYAYARSSDIKSKIEAVARKVYGASSIKFSSTASKKIKMLEEAGYSTLEVCIAKTQYSFSQNPKAYGAPEGFEFDIRDIVINAGAEIIVAIAGDIIRMPGLPKSPQALRIGVENGEIFGLS